MTGAADYGAALIELEALRAELTAADPEIAFDGWTPGGAARGEYRFRVGDRPCYVQAPITPAGRPRVWGLFWRFGCRPQLREWRYARNRAAVVAAILASR